MNDKKIEIGDIVKVDFFNAQISLTSAAIVHHVPCATNDSWQFECLLRNGIYYVSEPCTIILLSKGSDQLSKTNHPSP